MEYEKEPQSLSPWVLGGRVLFTLALAGCIWFIFSNSMAVADVSSVSSGRVLQLLQAGSLVLEILKPGLHVHVLGGHVVGLLVFVGHVACFGHGGKKVLVVLLRHPVGQADTAAVTGIRVFTAGFQIAARFSKGSIQRSAGCVVVLAFQAEVRGVDDLCVVGAAGRCCRVVLRINSGAIVCAAFQRHGVQTVIGCHGAVHSGAVGQVIDAGGVLLAVRLGVVAAGGGELLVVGVAVPNLGEQGKGVGGSVGVVLAVVLFAAGGQGQHQQCCQQQCDDFLYVHFVSSVFNVFAGSTGSFLPSPKP